MAVLQSQYLGLFDVACLNEQSRNNDGHEGSSDGVLSDYPTVYCGILEHGKDTRNSPEGPCRLFLEPVLEHVEI